MVLSFTPVLCCRFDDLWSRFETPDEKNRWDSPLFMLNDDDVAGVLESVVSIRVSSGAGSLSSDATAPLSAHGAGLDSLTLDDTSKHPDSTTSTGTDATVTASGTTAAAATTAARAYESPTFEAIAASLFKRASLRPPAAVILTKTAAPNFLHELDRRTAETLSFIVTAMSSAVVGDTIKIPGSSVGLQLARKVGVYLFTCRRSSGHDPNMYHVTSAHLQHAVCVWVSMIVRTKLRTACVYPCR